MLIQQPPPFIKDLLQADQGGVITARKISTAPFNHTSATSTSTSSTSFCITNHRLASTSSSFFGTTNHRLAADNYRYSTGVT